MHFLSFYSHFYFSKYFVTSVLTNEANCFCLPCLCLLPLNLTWAIFLKQLSAHRYLQHLWNHICHLQEALYNLGTELQQHCTPIVMYSSVYCSCICRSHWYVEYHVYLTAENNPGSSVGPWDGRLTKGYRSRITISPVDAFMQSCMFQLLQSWRGNANLQTLRGGRRNKRTGRDKLSINQPNRQNIHHRAT